MLAATKNSYSPTQQRAQTGTPRESTGFVFSLCTLRAVVPDDMSYLPSPRTGRESADEQRRKRL